MIIEETHTADLPMKLESTICPAKPTNGISGLCQRQTRIDEHSSNPNRVEGIESTGNPQDNLSLPAGVRDLCAGHRRRIDAHDVEVSIWREAVGLYPRETREPRRKFPGALIIRAEHHTVGCSSSKSLKRFINRVHSTVEIKMVRGDIRD